MLSPKTPTQVLKDSQENGIKHATPPMFTRAMRTVDDGLTFVKTLQRLHNVDRKIMGAFSRKISPVVATIEDSKDIDDQMANRATAYDIMAQHCATCAQNTSSQQASEDFTNAWMAANNESIDIQEEIAENQQDVMPKNRKEMVR